jgi:hypothetical protein
VINAESAGRLCDDLDKGLRGSEMNLHLVVNGIVAVIRDEAWRERRIRTGQIVPCESFLDLLTSPPLKGYGEDPRRIEALLKDDAEALRLYRAATIAPQGRPLNGDNVTTQNKTSNRSLKPLHGTTSAYTLTRLAKEQPALYQQVVAGTVSAHAAAVTAGFRQRTVTIPPTVDGFGRAIETYLSPDEEWRRLYHEHPAPPTPQ